MFSKKFITCSAVALSFLAPLQSHAGKPGDAEENNNNKNTSVTLDNSSDSDQNPLDIASPMEAELIEEAMRNSLLLNNPTETDT